MREEEGELGPMLDGSSWLTRRGVKRSEERQMAAVG
jgi:hypothetical protein